VVKYAKCNIAILMRERQAAMVLSILILLVIFTTESFADTPKCNGRDATRIGTNDNDIIRGSYGDDVIVSLGGNDIVYGMSGNDVICGGDGNDRLYGNSGNDILIGQEGFDSVNGGKGLDICDSFTDHHSSSHHSDDEDDDCETQYQETPVNNYEDLQKQIDYLQSQIKDIINDIIYWDEIQKIPVDIADGDDDTLGEITCDTDSGILVFDGSSWSCENNNFELECTDEQILKFDGTNWGCADLPTQEKDTVEIPIFFYSSTISGGQKQWLGTSAKTSIEKAADSVAIVMAKPWIVSNLYVKTAESADSPFPGDGEIYTITVLKNEQTPLLSCIIKNQETFCSDEKTAMIDKGETLVVKIESTFGALTTILRSSIILSPP